MGIRQIASKSGAVIIIIALTATIAVFTTGKPAFLAGPAVNALKRLIVTSSLENRPSLIQTSIYDLSLEEIAAPEDPGRGGALAALDDDVLLITRLGAFWRLDQSGGAFEKIALAAPGPVTTSGVFYTSPADFQTMGYRDLVLRETAAGDVDLFVSRTHIETSVPCVRLSVYAGRIGRAALFEGDARLDTPWRKIWDSQPCIADAGNTNPVEAGGDMALTPDGRLAVFVGHFGSDGVDRYTPEADAQKTDNDYGKVHALDLESGASEIVSIGHRNSGGLAVDDDGDLWLSENGPQGGDEINLVRAGANYGWPLETYGAQYGMKTWAPDPTNGVHENFTRPIYSFVPSRGMSSLAVAAGDEFPSWRGDLLLGTLASHRLIRLHIRDGRVIVAEPIWIGARIRDLTVDSAGRIYLKDDMQPFVYRIANAGAPAAEEDGPRAVLAKAGCATCHSLSGTARAGMTAPGLGGVAGRPIAAQQDFAYSPALDAKKGAWTRDALKTFITDPQSWAPGSAMPAPGLSEAQTEQVLSALEALSD